MEERVKKLETEGRYEIGKGEKERIEGMVERMRDIERKLEWREREKRKKNIVVRRLKDEGSIKSGIEKVMKDIGV